MSLTAPDILHYLTTDQADEVELLYARADAVRQKHVGPAVHLRGLIEVSNYCRRRCLYCGLNADNHQLKRYRMSMGEVLACANQAHQMGYGTVVLQAGEDPQLTTAWVTEVIKCIKSALPVAVTLSLGERETGDYAQWRQAGADRYLLRFETSNPALFARVHPHLQGQSWASRIDLLRQLRELGYEIGGGVMVGLPGQTWADLVNDLQLFSTLNLDMIGVGPWLAHPDTALGREAEAYMAASAEQVPNTEALTYRVIALARLLQPRANIPATTAMATLNTSQGRELCLKRGANVVMPNLTPPAYRQLYEIYPGKACMTETAEACHGCLQGRIESLGREIGTGRGDAPQPVRPVAGPLSGGNVS